MFQVKGVRFGTGRPKVCAPLTGTTREELLREAILARKPVLIWLNGVLIVIRMSSTKNN